MEMPFFGLRMFTEFLEHAQHVNTYRRTDFAQVHFEYNPKFTFFYGMAGRGGVWEQSDETCPNRHITSTYVVICGTYEEIHIAPGKRS